MRSLERLSLLAKLETDFYYGKLIKRISPVERAQVLDFIQQNGEDDADDFAHKVNRMHLEGAGFPKTRNFAIVQDILLACRYLRSA